MKRRGCSLRCAVALFGFVSLTAASASAQDVDVELQPPELRISRSADTRLRVLDGDLSAIAGRSGNNVLNGVLAVVSGGAVFTVGFFVEDDLIQAYLLVYGSAAVASGVVALAIMPDGSDYAIEYSHMPMGSPEEIAAKLRYGERALDELADRTRVARILDASLSIGVGLAIIPIYLVPNDFDVEDELDIFLLVGSGLSVISGIVNLIVPSEAERRRDAYANLRERLALQTTVRMGVSALYGGGALTIFGTF